jgi:ferredoxin
LPEIYAHFVTGKCEGCKFTRCVEVCPVSCFYEMDEQLVIHPEECIDCTVCVAECSVEKIYIDSAVPHLIQPDLRRMVDPG